MPEDIVERLTDWTSRHSNVTPLDGTDRDSPTFGDLRALLSALKEREEALERICEIESGAGYDPMQALSEIERLARASLNREKDA